MNDTIEIKLALALELIEEQKKALQMRKEYDFKIHEIIDTWLEMLANDKINEVMISMERRLNSYRTINPNNVL